MLWSPLGRPILVAGAPRTATSWVAKVLSLASFVSYLREPLMQGQLSGYGVELENLYLTSSAQQDRLERVWRRALGLQTRLTKRWLYGETAAILRQLPLAPSRLLVKEVVCVPSLEWLQAKFGFSIVVPLRHPCGFLASAMKLETLGHRTLRLEALVSQPELMVDFFSEHRDFVASARTPTDGMLMAYCMLLRIVEQQAARHPEWIVVQHEALCVNPFREFAQIFSRLNLPLSPKAIDFIRNSTETDDGQVYGLSRHSVRDADKWKLQLAPDVVRRAAEICATLGVRSY